MVRQARITAYGSYDSGVTCIFEKPRNAIIKNIEVIKKNIKKLRTAHTSLSHTLVDCLPSTNMVAL